METIYYLAGLTTVGLKAAFALFWIVVGIAAAVFFAIGIICLIVITVQGVWESFALTKEIAATAKEQAVQYYQKGKGGILPGPKEIEGQEYIIKIKGKE